MKCCTTSSRKFLPKNTLIPFGVADIKREGTDCTIVAINRCVHRAQEAAEELEAKMVSAVKSLTHAPSNHLISTPLSSRSRRPIVWLWLKNVTNLVAVLLKSRCKYNNWLSMILMHLLERVTQMECPLPYAANLEAESIPSAKRVAEAVRKACYK